MKKMKMNLGEGGIKGFIARNIEKIVFALAALLVIWLALPDSSRRPVDKDKLGPESITNTANNARTRLDQDTWELIKAERFRAPDDYVARADRTLIRVDRAGYIAEIPLDKPPFPPDKKRKDPTIYPPEQLEVVVNYGPITVTEKGKTTRIERRPTAIDADDARPLPPEVLARINKHGVPIGGAETKAQGKYIVALLAMVPTKRQADEYLATFKDAADYSETRDFPNYGVGAEDPAYGSYYYRVERAEIAPDGTEGQWKIIGDLKRARKLEETWPQVTELADAKYVDPVWSMAIPPLMLRDLRPLAMHSEVPSAAQAAEEAGAEEEEPEDDPTDDVEGPIVNPDEEDDGAGPRPPRSTPRPTITRPRNPRIGEGNIGMAGEGAMGAEDVDFKLFRYFDLDVQPGKSYVYRVKLYIEDPNDPSPSQEKPPLRVLDKTVIDRLTRKTDKNVWWRESDYSEVSPVVRVPATNQVLAGAVNPGKVVPAPGSPVGIRQSEETAKLKIVAWDEKRGMDVPGDLEVSRGSVVNFTADTEAIDVAEAVLKKLPAYEFQTGTIVLDLRGGEPLGKKGTDLSAPGEMLLIDAEGNLVVRKELDDRAAFAENTFPEEPESTEVEGLAGEEEEDKRPRTRPKPPRGSEGIDLMDDRASPRPPRQPRRDRDRDRE